MAEVSYPDDLLYHPEHDWARVDDEDIATLGITWYAQDSLGEVVFFEPPTPGTTVTKDEPYAEVEVNEALGDTPNAINDDPYGEGWLVKIRLSNPAERGDLLDADAYSASLG
jgi:glycine cleavage system H protein